MVPTLSSPAGVSSDTALVISVSLGSRLDPSASATATVIAIGLLWTKAGGAESVNAVECVDSACWSQREVLERILSGKTAPSGVGSGVDLLDAGQSSGVGVVDGSYSPCVGA